MDELEKKKEIVKLEKKLRNEPGGQEWIDELRKGSLKDLRFKLTEFAEYRQALITTRLMDDKLIDAKKKVTGLNKEYTRGLKGNDEKTRFIGLLIQEITGEEDVVNEEEVTEEKA